MADLLKHGIAEKEDGTVVVTSGKDKVTIKVEDAAALKASGFNLAKVLEWLQTFGPLIAQLLVALFAKKHPVSTKAKLSLEDFTDPKKLLVELLSTYKDQLKGEALKLLGEGIDILLEKLGA